MDEQAKQTEEEKRNRAYDPVARWAHYLDAIKWVEGNTPPEQRRNRPRWRDAQGHVHNY